MRQHQWEILDPNTAEQICLNLPDSSPTFRIQPAEDPHPQLEPGGSEWTVQPVFTKAPLEFSQVFALQGEKGASVITAQWPHLSFC